MALLLLKADATVTIVHSRTPDSEKIIQEADIVIAAAGQAMMVPIIHKKFEFLLLDFLSYNMQTAN